MFSIERVEITGFWGSYTLTTDFDEDVNIFIGRNGSGKTTFINLLEATLTADLELLDTLKFETIELSLRDGRRVRTILLTRVSDVFPNDVVVYKIGRKKFTVPLIPKEGNTRQRLLRTSYRFAEELIELRSYLNKLVNVSWLSVHREILEDEYREPGTRRTVRETNPVERRISDLSNRFTSYQLQLQSEVNKLSEEFRKEVLASILYDEEFDRYDPNTMPETINLNNTREILLRTYDDLNALDETISEKIEKHVNRLGKSLEAVDSFLKKGNKDVTIDDFLPLPLLSRTRHIVGSSISIETKKKTILKTVNMYLDTLASFINDKTFTLSPDLDGELIVQKGKTRLKLSQLSSGEKQLYILLTEALLQKGNRFVFIADEPELSLHIEWQRQLLKEIRKLNPQSQIIVATHSPEIAGPWKTNIRRMEQIIHE